MEGKILAEVYVPAARETLDVWVPVNVPLVDLSKMLAKSAAALCSGAFVAMQEQALVCDRASGRVFALEKTPRELGFQNGVQLMLV